MFLYSIFYLAEKFNIIHIKTGWFFAVATIDIFGMLLFVYFLDKLFSNVRTDIWLSYWRSFPCKFQSRYSRSIPPQMAAFISNH
jgi:hypothetical protein